MQSEGLVSKLYFDTKHGLVRGEPFLSKLELFLCKFRFMANFVIIKYSLLQFINIAFLKNEMEPEYGLEISLKLLVNVVEDVLHVKRTRQIFPKARKM